MKRVIMREFEALNPVISKCHFKKILLRCKLSAHTAFSSVCI